MEGENNSLRTKATQLWHYGLTQVVFIGVLAFCCPGMFNALNGLGKVGAKNEEVGNIANAAVYGSFALFGYFGGACFNIFGNRVLMFVGGLGYAIYAAGIYIALNYESAGFLAVVVGGILGFSAGWFWTAQGAMIMSYAANKEKGLFVSVFWVIFNLGGMIGGLLMMGVNWNSTNLVVATRSGVVMTTTPSPTFLGMVSPVLSDNNGASITISSTLASNLRPGIPSNGTGVSKVRGLFDISMFDNETKIQILARSGPYLKKNTTTTTVQGKRGERGAGGQFFLDNAKAFNIGLSGPYGKNLKIVNKKQHRDTTEGKRFQQREDVVEFILPPFQESTIQKLYQFSEVPDHRDVSSNVKSEPNNKKNAKFNPSFGPGAIQPQIRKPRQVETTKTTTTTALSKLSTERTNAVKEQQKKTMNKNGIIQNSGKAPSQGFHSTDDSANSTSYFAFVVIMTLGAIGGLALVTPSKVIRSDSQIVQFEKKESIKEELKSALLLFKNRTMCLLTILFLSSNWFYAYQFNAINGTMFNIRTRGFNSAVYWMAQMIGSLIIGKLLDWKTLSTRRRGYIGFSGVIILVLVSYGFGWHVQFQYAVKPELNNNNPSLISSNMHNLMEPVQRRRLLDPVLLNFDSSKISGEFPKANDNHNFAILSVYNNARRLSGRGTPGTPAQMAPETPAQMAPETVAQGTPETGAPMELEAVAQGTPEAGALVELEAGAVTADDVQWLMELAFPNDSNVDCLDPDTLLEVITRMSPESRVQPDETMIGSSGTMSSTNPAIALNPLKAAEEQKTKQKHKRKRNRKQKQKRKQTLLRCGGLPTQQLATSDTLHFKTPQPLLETFPSVIPISLKQSIVHESIPGTSKGVEAEHHLDAVPREGSPTSITKYIISACRRRIYITYKRKSDLTFPTKSRSPALGKAEQPRISIVEDDQIIDFPCNANTDSNANVYYDAINQEFVIAFSQRAINYLLTLFKLVSRVDKNQESPPLFLYLKNAKLEIYENGSDNQILGLITAFQPQDIFHLKATPRLPLPFRTAGTSKKDASTKSLKKKVVTRRPQRKCTKSRDKSGPSPSKRKRRLQEKDDAPTDVNKEGWDKIWNNGKWNDPFDGYKIDLSDGFKRTFLPMFTYVLYGFTDAAVQTYAYWHMASAAGDDTFLAARFAGYYKGIQSIGACISWILDLYIPYKPQFWICLSLFLVGVPFVFVSLRDLPNLIRTSSMKDMSTSSDMMNHGL